MAELHPTAQVDPGAVLADGVVVGPHCVVGDRVSIGAGTRLGPHCVVEGPTVIGEGNDFHGQASVGGPSQAKARSEAGGALEMGDGNVVREFVTINRGSAQGGVTKIGSGNWLMACCHVGHDCRLGDDIVLTNATLLGGEVQVADHARLAGAAMVHQQCRLGAHSFVAAGALLTHDLPPYAKYSTRGEQVIVTINRVGLEREGLGDSIGAIKRAFDVLYHRGNRLVEAVAQLRDMAAAEPAVAPLAEFVAAESKYGLLRPRNASAG